MPAKYAEIFAMHNARRAELGSPPLVWNPAAASGSQSWAETLANTQDPSQPRLGCAFFHGGEYGGAQVLAMSGQVDEAAALREAFDRWYAEGALIGYSASAPFAQQTGHFTAIVKREHKSVGCGISQCRWGTPRAPKIVACGYGR